MTARSSRPAATALMALTMSSSSGADRLDRGQDLTAQQLHLVLLLRSGLESDGVRQRKAAIESQQLVRLGGIEPVARIGGQCQHRAERTVRSVRRMADLEPGWSADDVIRQTGLAKITAAIDQRLWHEAHGADAVERFHDFAVQQPICFAHAQPGREGVRHQPVEQHDRLFKLGLVFRDLGFRREQAHNREMRRQIQTASCAA